MTVELLQQLIRIPSVNPEGDPGTSHVGENEIACFLEQYLVGIGAEVELREVEPGRPNVVARFPARKKDLPRIAFAPHTDTVTVKGMTIDPFGGNVSDGKIWGRGATDTKGSMAAMLSALKSASLFLQDLSCEIWFCGLMGEEAGLQGSRALATQEKFDFVIAGEPTELCAVTSHKGAARLKLWTEGVAAHASTPEAGVNAIDGMTDLLKDLREQFPGESTVDPVLGSPTISVGTIKGGTKSNVVPDYCEAHVDIRSVPGFNVEGFLQRWQQRHPACHLDFLLSPPLQTDPSHGFVNLLNEMGAKSVVAPWFCDAASFAEKGMPAVALGPGHISQAHTVDEWISIEDLEAGAHFFLRLLEKLRAAHPFEQGTLNQ